MDITKNYSGLATLCYFNIIGFFISDIIYHVFAKNSIIYIRPTLIIKTLFLVLFFYLIAKNYNRIKYKEILLILGIISFLFLLEQILFKSKFNFKNSIFFGRYIYIMPMYLVYSSLLNRDKEIKKAIFLIEYIYIFNASLMIIAVFFDIDFFKRYSDARFGYTGFFSRDSISYLSCLMIFYYHYLLMKKWSYKNFLLFALAIFIGLITGTKSIYLFLILFFIYLLITKEKRMKPIIVFIVFAIAIFCSTNAFKKTYSLFYRIYEENGLVNSITSHRSELLNNIISGNSFYENLKLFLFGGIDYSAIRRPEMELFDLIFYFGIFATILIYYFYYKYLYVKFYCKENKFILLTFFIMAFFVSNFIHNINLSLWLIIFCSYFLNEKKISLQKM
ncbi:O-antigen polymerase [Wocania ichthyoenteri]|uniref:O-antigen polymerase n=1 Tax=Wocania ichthyoenteri TaxID=1230531 RepID=UPI00053DE5E9|nr:O-antigen polymerase [Wocania ichthyoenteri]